MDKLVEKMTDKEVYNIGQIKEFLAGRDKYNTGAYTIFRATVTYESQNLQTQVLPDTEVQYQYVDQPAIFIHSLNPPYYEQFRTDYQSFTFDGSKLLITGRGMDGYTYKLTIE